MPDYNVFPDYKTRKEIINELCDRYKFIKHCFAGKSVCGRGIDVLHIGNTKNRVLYCGGFHGSEYLTILALLKFFEECCEAMESDKTVGGCKIGNFLSIRGLTIVPCVNPDGTEIALHGSDAAFKYKRSAPIHINGRQTPVELTSTTISMRAGAGLNSLN